MGENKITIEKTVDINQAAAFLRLLAAELEGKSSPELNEAGIQLHDFNKMKVRLVKQEGGQLTLTIKVKNQSWKKVLPRATATFTDIAAREYRPFKQELKATFAKLKECAGQAALPPPELLTQFMAQSKRLITFAGFGEPCYHDYWQACLAMEQAAKEGAEPAFQERLIAIAAIKNTCHNRFK